MYYYEDNETEKSIQQLISLLFKDSEHEKKLIESSIKFSWKEIVGDFIASKTSKVMIKNKILYINADSSSLKNELIFLKESLIKKVNQFANKEIINDIIIS